jgi:valyl-tRNA synthetase
MLTARTRSLPLPVLTQFLMELAKAYDPKEAEEHHYERWEESGFFAPEINQDPSAQPYSIVIPPPNVTGSLHMGHALQHTLMDVLVRRKRMQGYRTLWLPGTDHAGISVQRKIVEQLKQEGKTPTDVGRDEFIRRAWVWKEEYGNTITEQMRREGASVDWTRHRFTMDDSLSMAVRNVFCTLYEEGWIYRGLRIVNWCPRDKTVLSDLEVKEETERDGKLYYLRYPVATVSSPTVREGSTSSGDQHGALTDVRATDTITVATTRPETMLGDTAVAVNPQDQRYKHLIGEQIALPLTGRTIPIVADEYVDAEFGTGAVKVTPAHDPNDYQIGERHNLEKLLVMNDDGTMNAAAGADFAGLDRFKAREKVVERFDELGLLERVEDYEISLPICERCKTIVEPILSEQWFVRMDEMRDMALELMREQGVPHFFPQVPHEKVYTAWLENLKDWTISRQLWWGHQIPAWYDEDGNVYVARNEEEAVAKSGGKSLTQDSDVLDTWFSSGLWAFSTFGWNGKVTESDDLDEFLPTDVLVTGRDIIFLWVSRMIMLTRKFTGKKAFDDVVVTGTVLGKDGKPMSKSRNNGVDPIEMFDKFGVDATRIYLASIATGADIKWNDSAIETYRNFANKIWNATRFCLLNSEGAFVDHTSLLCSSPPYEGGVAPASGDGVVLSPDSSSTGVVDSTKNHPVPTENVGPPLLRKEGSFGLADRWIISRLNQTALDVNKALDKYEFHTAVSLLYHFFWDDFCDWYIELKKDEINAGDVAATTRILTVLEIALRMLHPFMPYLTEELWLKLPGVSNGLHHEAYAGADATIMLTSFPPGDEQAIDASAESEMGAVIDVIKRVRNIRTEMQISPSIKFDVHIAADGEFQQVFRANQAQILKLARAEKLVIGRDLDVPKASAKAVTGEAQVAVPLEGLIDFDKERERLSNQIAKLTEEKTRLGAQLANQSFVERAPVEKVEALRERSKELEKQIETLNNNLEALE